jgi:hypothetical protein
MLQSLHQIIDYQTANTVYAIISSHQLIHGENIENIEPSSMATSEQSPSKNVTKTNHKSKGRHDELMRFAKSLSQLKIAAEKYPYINDSHTMHPRNYS